MSHAKSKTISRTTCDHKIFFSEKTNNKSESRFANIVRRPKLGLTADFFYQKRPSNSAFQRKIMIDFFIRLFESLLYSYSWLCAIIAVLRWAFRTKFELSSNQRKAASKYRFVVVGAGADFEINKDFNKPAVEKSCKKDFLVLLLRISSS